MRFFSRYTQTGIEKKKKKDAEQSYWTIWMGIYYDYYCYGTRLSADEAYEYNMLLGFRRKRIMCMRNSRFKYKRTYELRIYYYS